MDRRLVLNALGQQVWVTLDVGTGSVEETGYFVIRHCALTPIHGNRDQACHGVFTCNRSNLCIVVALRGLDKGCYLFPFLQELDLGVGKKLLRLGLAVDIVG